MSLRWWSRKGEPIDDVIEWALLYEDIANRCVAVDSDGPESPMVSTIWTGMPSMQYEFPMDTFETAILVDGEVKEFRRTNNEEDALGMHTTFCWKFLHRAPRPEDGHVQTIIENERRARGK